MNYEDLKEKQGQDKIVVETASASQAAECPLVQVDEGISAALADRGGHTPPVPVAENRDRTLTPLEPNPPDPQSGSTHEQPVVPPSILLFARRFAALMIDQVILTCVFSFLFVPPTLALFYFNGIAPLNVPIPLQVILLLVWLVVAVVAIFFLLVSYCAKFESSRWQATPGKMLMGLSVVDDHGKRISYAGVVWRLIIQGFINVWLGPWLAALLISSLVSAKIDISTSFRTSMSVFAVALCYMISLFTIKRQTLFDIATHRIVESNPSPLREHFNRAKLHEAFEITFGPSGKRDWLLLLCACCAAISLIPSLFIVPLVCYSVSETNQAIRESAENVRKNQHYLNAHRWFRNIDSIYYMLAKPLDQAYGDSDRAAEYYRKATIIEPNDWLVRGDYGMLLDSQGKVKEAKRELAKMVDLASKGIRWGEGEHWDKSPTREEKGPFHFGKYGTLSYGDLYLKLGKLSIQLGEYTDAIAYLDKAIENGRTDSDVYLSRSSAYRALGNITQAELDKKKAAR